MSGTTGAVCEKCGTAVGRGARFCASCGTEVSNPVGATGESTVMVSNTAVLKDRFLETLRDITLGEYEILLEIGSGGMASVYLAHDIQLDRKVAIKAMHPQLLQGDGMVERFRLEARTVANLSHPNIVPIYAVKQEQDLLLFVMKFIEGQPLDAIIKGQAPLPPIMVSQILSRVADALGYAHRHGVIHRDIKPANIMVDIEGQPVVTDFGIAKVANTEGLTMTGAAIGTPHYMSPEQCHAMPLSGATDQYSLGVTAYQMITGSLPFEGGSAMNIMFKHAHEPPPPLMERVPNCPPELAAVIERMLAKRPEDRFARMEDVVRALNAPTMDHDDPVRSQLIQFAMQGENRRLLKRVSTPRSPVPLVAAGSPGPSPKTRRAAAAKVATASSTVAATSAPRRNPLLIGGAVVVIALLGVLGVLQPWKSRAPVSPASPSVAQAPGAGLPEPAPTTPVQQDSNGVAGAGLVESTAVAVDSTSLAPAVVPTKPAVQKPPVPKPQRPAGRTDVPPPGASPSTSRLVPLQAVQVTGPNSLTVGESVVLDADAIDGAGHSVPGRQIVWKSSAPEVATVSADGQVMARQPGRALVSATVEQVSGSMAITVQAAVATTLAITPADLTLEAGKTGTLSATLLGGSGHGADQKAQWSSGAPQIATVNSDGTVTARTAGTATITAVSGGRVATATVTVTAAAGPSEADLRTQAEATIQAYARALETRDVARVRQVFPSMPSLREQQLKQALPNMKNLQVRLTVTDLQLAGEVATVVVSGKWQFQASGQRNELPADNVYQLARRGTGWVITEIR